MKKQPKKKKKPDSIQITELFLAKAGRGLKGFDRRFYGTIKREKTEDGEDFVFSKIRVNDGYIYSAAKDQYVLGDNLDQLVILILDNNLHGYPGKFTKIVETKFFHN